MYLLNGDDHRIKVYVKQTKFLMMMNVCAEECEYPREGGKFDFSETGGG